MELLDVSIVTKALVSLITERLKTSPVLSATGPVNVSSRPPDKLKDEPVVGMYLYHIQEEAQYKNVPPPGEHDVPVCLTPMGLLLHYVLTARSKPDADDAALEEQKVMGLAMKALHDYPVIDEKTTVNGQKLFPNDPPGAKGRVRIVLHPVSPSEGIQYWTAGSQPLRLAAYYQVSAVLLEPEPVTERYGRVLSYGVHTFLGDAPRLAGSRNTIEFKIPAEDQAREVECRPAQVPVGGQVQFFGTGLADDETVLMLRHPTWEKAVELDPLAWAVQVSPERVTATIREKAGDNKVLPGLYSASIRVISRRTLPNGSVREFKNVSNETPFAVTPSVDQEKVEIAHGVGKVTGWWFDGNDLSPEDIQIFIGPDKLELVSQDSPDNGQFCLKEIDNKPGIQFKVPADVTPGNSLPLRILIRGAESAPKWIAIP